MVAGAAFTGIFFLALPYPLIVLSALFWGFTFFARDAGAPADPQPLIPVSMRKTMLTVTIWLALWLLPLLLIDQLTADPVFPALGVFFARLAVVTFGGAYAVLAYMAQDVVTHFGWLSAGEMMDGLGLAETTPGPLILVTEFVGFLAAFRSGGLLSGVGGAALVLWVTFVPCFMWIFAGAPWLERISAQPRLNGALSAVTAAIVGVILNLAIWFALHVLFKEVVPRQSGPLTLWTPDLSSLDGRAALLTGLCAVLLLKFRWSIPRVLVLSALAGWALSALS